MHPYSVHLLRHLRFTIGQNIHRHRHEQNLPLEQLASLASIPEDILTRYEHGKNEIRLSELLRIACALKVEMGELLGAFSRQDSLAV